MIEAIQDIKGYDRKMDISSDWRFAAAALGMIRYFQYHGMNYQQEGDILLYHSNNIGVKVQEKYYGFVENYYKNDLHHKAVENSLISGQALSEEQEKTVNERLSGNTVMKKIFKGYKYSPEIQEEILQIVEENRQELIRETYRNMKQGYKKFANENLLQREEGNVCRLKGFTVDAGRKTKCISYNFDDNNFGGKDFLEFDFIPFAFTRGYEAIFINNNFSLDDLVRTNKIIQKELEEASEGTNFRKTLFLTLDKGVPFIDFDVEVIVKERDEDFYKTLFIRKSSIEIFKQLGDLEKDVVLEEKNIYKALIQPCRLSNGEYISVLKEVCDHILNQVYLDYLIETLIKDTGTKEFGSYRHGFLTSQLIRINEIVYKGDKGMDDRGLKASYAVAKRIVAQLKSMKAENKIPSYRQKLISCLVFKNYDRFMEVMLQLSSYSQVPMDFLYQLAEDFEGNKNIAYNFVNSLEDFDRKKEEKGGNSNE